jgi:alcohol dehydrogenase class IV
MEQEILLNLRKFLAPEIVYGAGALGLAGRHAVNFGATKVLIVSDHGVAEHGWTKKVEKSLEEHGLPFYTFLDVTPNPKDYEVMKGVDLYREECCDLIIAVGGGSPMDCAKGIGAVAHNDGHITDFEGVDEILNPAPPLIFIPTTAGTSADVSQFAIITDTRREVKIAIVSKMAIPDIALVDPLTTVSMPPELTAETGMDALCHAFEAYVSTAASPLTDMAAVSAIRLVFSNLYAAYCNPEDINARNNMMMASLMAGLAFSNASLGLVHAMAHSLGGLKNFPHGECNALLLEKVIDYNYPAAALKYDQILEAIGIDFAGFAANQRVNVLTERVAALRRQVGIVQSLSEMGLAMEDLPRLAEYAHQDTCLATNPREATPDVIEELYRKVY